MSGGRGWHVTGARRGSRPSPKRGPATPSRLALNEASWSGTARSAGYEWISEPAARVYDRLTPACPNNLERQKRLLDLLIRVELRDLVLAVLVVVSLAPIVQPGEGRTAPS